MRFPLSCFVFIILMLSGFALTPAKAVSPCSLLDGVASTICGLGYSQVKNQIKPENFLKQKNSENWRPITPTASQRRKYGHDVQCFERETQSESIVKCQHGNATNPFR